MAVTRDYGYLPTEIVAEVLDYVTKDPEHAQSNLYNACLVSRAWYSAAISRLYRAPRLKGWNFVIFVNSVCPSINATVRKSPLAPLVEEIDMRHLVYESSKSLTGRLIGRCKENLKVFVAPQASFGISSLSALSKCQNVVHLDLRLVCEAVSVRQLLRTLTQLKAVKHLTLPICRLAADWDNHIEGGLPPNIKKLSTTIGARTMFLGHIEIPGSLDELEILGICANESWSRPPVSRLDISIQPNAWQSLRDQVSTITVRDPIHPTQSNLLLIFTHWTVANLKHLHLAIEFSPPIISTKPSPFLQPPYVLEHLSFELSGYLPTDHEKIAQMTCVELCRLLLQTGEVTDFPNLKRIEFGRGTFAIMNYSTNTMLSLIQSDIWGRHGKDAHTGVFLDLPWDDNVSWEHHGAYENWDLIRNLSATHPLGPWSPILTSQTQDEIAEMSKRVLEQPMEPIAHR
ncbi:MAG: hypothetical protein M1814_005207 [Vezdaea aestivalis]|nr:MAG: hypothetical protein M1814_005207 [Vezdaea aestivalis]